MRIHGSVTTACWYRAFRASSSEQPAPLQLKVSRYKREKWCPEGTADRALFSLGEAVSLNNFYGYLSSHKWLSPLSPKCRRPSYIINIHVYGLTIWVRYSIKPHTHKKTLALDHLLSTCILMLLVVHHFHLTSPVCPLLLCPPKSPIPATELTTTIHQLWSTQQWLSLCTVRGQLAGWGLFLRITYWSVPSWVLTSTEKVEKCDPAVQAALSPLHHHLYHIYFAWALNDVASPSLECNA